MKYGIGIEVPRRSRSCHTCEKPFEKGHEYFSMLLQEQKGLLRNDFCPACWKQQPCFTYWKARIPEKLDQREEEKSRLELAFEIMREAIAQDNLEEAFILSLFLARKKYLILREEVDHEGEKVQLYEVVHSEEMLPIKRVDVTRLEVDRIQKQISEKLII